MKDGDGQVTFTVQKTEKQILKITLLQIDKLKPHEKGSPLYLELLKNEILKDGVLKYPIIADEKTKVILDGMHRWLALKSLGYKQIPVILIEASQNPKIRVGSRRIHRYINDSKMEITTKEVISAGISGNLMKPRTTRHFFPFIKPPKIACPLNSLEKGVPQDVSRYLAKMSIEECQKAIEDWLMEISEELDFLRNRTLEVEKEREEFLNRIKNLKISNNFF